MPIGPKGEKRPADVIGNRKGNADRDGGRKAVVMMNADVPAKKRDPYTNKATL